MFSEPDDRTGILVVRAWTDARQLRARVTYSTDLGDEEHATVVTASPAEVLQIVSAWLDELDVGKESAS